MGIFLLTIAYVVGSIWLALHTTKGESQAWLWRIGLAVALISYLLLFPVDSVLRIEMSSAFTATIMLLAAATSWLNSPDRPEDAPRPPHPDDIL